MTRKQGKSFGSSHVGGQAAEEQVVDFNQVREKKLAEKRRNNERIFFKDLLSVYSMTGTSKMLPIDLIDVSEEGCSFQLPHNPENPWPQGSSELAIRLYFSRNTYLEIQVTIQNSRDAIENNVRHIRYGCSVDTSLKSYPAYQSFVRFLKLYAENSHKDMGNVTLFYL